MYTFSIIAGVSILGLLVLNGMLLWFLLRGKRKEAAPEGQGLVMLQEQMHELARTVDRRLGDSSREIGESMRSQLGESARLVREVTEGLTKLDETNKQVVSFAQELQNLSDVLKNPKQRGVLGEYYLESVLGNVLPPGVFKMQYAFANGEIVDAVIFIKDRILPIDSKFSLENYNRLLECREPAERERLERLFKQDLKLRIDETAKYVRPQEGTLEFAFMFIPSEGIYYDLLANQVGAVRTSARDLIEYAFSKKVIIVSPTSFLAYLQTVLQGLKALQVEEEAQEIMKRVGELGRHVANYDTYYQKLGSALGVTVNHYNAGAKELKKIDRDVLRITGESIALASASIDKPEQA